MMELETQDSGLKTIRDQYVNPSWAQTENISEILVGKEELGRGAIALALKGEVRMKDGSMHPVAVKVRHDNLTPTLKKSFTEEVGLTDRMRKKGSEINTDPHVLFQTAVTGREPEGELKGLRKLIVGEQGESWDDDRPLLIMPLAPENTLSKLVMSGKMTEEKLLAIARQYGGETLRVLEAMGYKDQDRKFGDFYVAEDEITGFSYLVILDWNVGGEKTDVPANLWQLG